jgi:hypothetical protein
MGQLAARLAIAHALVEFLADGIRQPRDFAGASAAARPDGTGCLSLIGWADVFITTN